MPHHDIPASQTPLWAAYREAGRDTPHIMAPTLCSSHANIDTETMNYGDQQAAVFKAIGDKFFSQPDRHVPGLFVTGKSTAHFL